MGDSQLKSMGDNKNFRLPSKSSHSVTRRILFVPGVGRKTRGDRINGKLRFPKGTRHAYVISAQRTKSSFILRKTARTFASCFATACRVIGIPVICIKRFAISVGLPPLTMREQRQIARRRLNDNSASISLNVAVFRAALRSSDNACCTHSHIRSVALASRLIAVERR